MSQLIDSPSSDFAERNSANTSQAILKFDVPVPKTKHIRQFQQLYQEHYGRSLSEREAAEKLTLILILVRYRQYQKTLPK